MLFRDFLKDRLVVLDGGTGTLLQEAGLPAGVPTERWNLERPDVLTSIHRAYFDAGTTLVATNTFGVNALKYSEEEIARYVGAAVKCARLAAKESGARGEKFVALDVGPLGRLLAPLGDLDFEDAVSAFAPVIRAGTSAGVDAILIETMSDLYETKAALLAAKENSDLPVLVSNAYGSDGRLMTGATPDVVVATLEGLGADAIGVNCSQGPRELAPVVREYLRLSSLPVLCKPNAGLPRVEGEKTVFDVSPDEFAALLAPLAREGVRLCGGCCGTTPEHIAALAGAVADLAPVPVTEKRATVVSSGTKTVDFSHTPVLIGERINPTGKKRFREALAGNDMGYILSEGIRQTERGAHILDVNVGAPGIDEKQMLARVAGELSAVTDLPLCLDTSDPAAMEKALRRYNGKPLVNSVNGKRESMEKIFPLVKKYGGVLVALTLDEDGIPASADGRVAVAKKILAEAKKYGLSEKDLVFDPLTLTVSADGGAANVTLEAVRRIGKELGCHTSLGVSNVSFGLPARAGLNAAFFTLALENGLSAAIVNPDSPEMMNAYFSYRALRGIDKNCLDYIRFADANAAADPSLTAGTPRTLADAVEKGLGAEAAQRAKELLGARAPLDIVNEQIIPALDRVGAAYEEKRVFLPQLLLSAEAASAAFGVVKAALPAASATRYPVVLATVRGDIHDIGKNIVKLILENYGFAVSDLGRDVPPGRIVDEAVRLRAPLVGLSALMTTTVPAMEETIRLLRAGAPFCKVVVGGAVLTKDYAEKIGADAYAKDAMETVRFAESLI